MTDTPCYFILRLNEYFESEIDGARGSSCYANRSGELLAFPASLSSQRALQQTRNFSPSFRGHKYFRFEDTWDVAYCSGRNNKISHAESRQFVKCGAKKHSFVNKSQRRHDALVYTFHSFMLLFGRKWIRLLFCNLEIIKPTVFFKKAHRLFCKN